VSENIADAESGWYGLDGFEVKEVKIAVLQSAGDTTIVTQITNLKRRSDNLTHG
jgi:hypothetical protein